MTSFFYLSGISNNLFIIYFAFYKTLTAPKEFVVSVIYPSDKSDYNALYCLMEAKRSSKLHLIH